MIIDVHAHAYPTDYFDHLKKAEGRGGRTYEDILEKRLALMDEAGVQRQILSPTQGPYFAGEEDGVIGARMVNNAFAKMSRDMPDRFSFFAAMPLPFVDKAVDEVKRGFDELGAVGAMIHCFVRNESIAQDAYEPVWQELNRRKAVVFLHPCQNGLGSHLINDWGLTVCCGASLEDSVVAMQLIAKRIPERYPDIKFIIPHFGGLLPMLLNRLDGQMNRSELNEAPSVTARRFFYDCVGWGSKAALLAAVTAFGESQIVTGSDYPILVPWEGYKQTFQHIREGGLPEETVEHILHHNTRDLFGDRLPKA